MLVRMYELFCGKNPQTSVRNQYSSRLIRSFACVAVFVVFCWIRLLSRSMISASTSMSYEHVDPTVVCNISDAALLQHTLYREFPAFYQWMRQKKAIEEAFATLEYDRKFGRRQENEAVLCEDGFCNVASGGIYLCPPVLQGLRSVVQHIGGPVCVVGSGSFSTEAWLLHTTAVDVVTFDLLNSHYKIKLVESLRTTFPDRRWTIHAGPFEGNKQKHACKAIMFDTNIRGYLSVMHWQTIETTLTDAKPYMWVVESKWLEYPSYCANSTMCRFDPYGKTETKDGCFPDWSVVPQNMHPDVLKTGNSFNVEYQFGKWN